MRKATPTQTRQPRYDLDYYCKLDVASLSSVLSLTSDVSYFAPQPCGNDSGGDASDSADSMASGAISLEQPEVSAKRRSQWQKV